tara:strand:- start:5511 stop:5891 length:381 start_codon:yes stop_codon:yes gene_type:complete
MLGLLGHETIKVMEKHSCESSVIMKTLWSFSRNANCIAEEIKKEAFKKKLEMAFVKKERESEELLQKILTQQNRVTEKNLLKMKAYSGNSYNTVKLLRIIKKDLRILFQNREFISLGSFVNLREFL